MKEIIVIGAGGHAAEINDYLNYSNLNNDTDYEIIGYLDDDPLAFSRYNLNGSFLGAISDHVVDKNRSYIIGIANLKFRKLFIDQFIANGAKFLTYIHPSAYISPSAEIGEGVVIAPNVNIGPNVIIGDFTLVNSRSSIGHDTILGEYNFISPNVCFSGFSKVGDQNLFGINSATIPGIKVGSGNTIAAGIIINRDIKDNETVFHRYKEKISVIRS